MAHRDLVVVGASAGGVEALKELVAGLPAGLRASVVVVLHTAPSATSALPSILSRSGPLPARHARDGETLLPGHVYAAPPDRHLLVHNGRLRLSTGPRVNGYRPAIDPLFLSASRWRRNRAIGVVLSGVLDDGSNGSFALRRQGAITFGQSPETAQYAAMPQSAIENGGIVEALPIPAIARRIVELVGEELAEVSPAESESSDIEEELEVDPIASAAVTGPASGFTCPDCHGALWEVKEGELTRFRCRIGHSYGSDTLFALQSEKIEEALWAGYRALEENASLAKRLGERAAARGSASLAERYAERYRAALERAATLREILVRGQLDVADPESS